MQYVHKRTQDKKLCVGTGTDHKESGPHSANVEFESQLGSSILTDLPSIFISSQNNRINEEQKGMISFLEAESF
jgi:hypothetical protein